MSTTSVGGVAYPNSSYKTDLNGNIVGLLGRDGLIQKENRWSQSPSGYTIISPPVSGITVTPGADCTVNSSGQTTLNGETVWTVSITGTGTPNNYAELVVPDSSNGFVGVSTSIECSSTDWSKCVRLTVYVGNSNFSVYANHGRTAEWTPSNSHSDAINNILTTIRFPESVMTKNGYSDEHTNHVFTRSKLRLYVGNGQTLIFSLRSITIGSEKKARIAITADDGYSTWMDQGRQICERYGFVSTMGIIPSRVGTSTYASLSELQRYVAVGNECVAHGTGLGGNIFTDFSNDTDRMNYIQSVVTYLKGNGLTSSLGSKCFIWPQGRISNSTSDTALLTSLSNSGFTAGRGVNVPTYYSSKMSAVSRYNQARLTMPIIGHSYNSGDEAGNITAITTKIQQIVNDKADACLMFHRIDESPTIPEMISPSNLHIIMAAMKTHVDAGNLDVVLFSDFAF